jgi:maleylpyruvate isomerase
VEKLGAVVCMMQGAMSELVLYTYWRSSSSHRVRLALGYKRLQYRSVGVNLLANEQSGPAHSARAPNAYVPSLEMDGEVFVESVAILELLEELHPDPPLYPKAPKDRARVRAMVETVNAGVQPLQNLAVLMRHSEDHDERIAWARHFNARGLGVLERMMDQNDARGVRGPFAYGAAFGAADVMMIPQLASAVRFGVDLAPFPRVRSAVEASADLPFVKAAAPEAQPDAPK